MLQTVVYQIHMATISLTNFLFYFHRANCLICCRCADADRYFITDPKCAISYQRAQSNAGYDPRSVITCMVIGHRMASTNTNNNIFVKKKLIINNDKIINIKYIIIYYSEMYIVHVYYLIFYARRVLRGGKLNVYVQLDLYYYSFSEHDG